ncbi:dehydrodolichyl diphosphate synthase complex subunit Nus1 [Galleria mellonella]|uniref:ditrans,polycis-polyprenyl diphosphate synthase [(2E,6E)-farnesyldiphosphate specific] n=1 Tax=Galleria mellonella TaxID=7137 RepID=A0A6J1WF04_GALME|nr:dehydrodolichyl diphosphate synthase complex subunit Nus1 [Galleria mellonella]
MLSRLLRQFLYNLIHLIVSVLVAVQNVYHQFWDIKSNLFKSEVTNNDIKIILKLITKMNKKLNHLVILADTDHHSLADLARVVIWSLIAGIPYVSFHDITGELRHNEEKLFREVERSKKGIPGFIKWSKMPDLNGYTNGVQGHTVVINIFSNSDGRPTIAQCIQDIAKGTVHCERKSSEYSAQELGKTLALYYPSIPDPDLILYSGSLCCTKGLLPWQIRLAEFIQLSLDYHITIDSYVSALYKYNKYDQRFGK